MKAWTIIFNNDYFRVSLRGWIILTFLLSISVSGYPQDTSQIKKYIDSATVYSNKLFRALPDIDTALHLAIKQADRKSIASVLVAKGKLYQKHHLLKQADSSFSAAKRILQKYPKDKAYLVLLKNLSICNYYLNNNQKVYEYATEGLKFSKQLNEKSLEGTFNNILGIVMDNMGNKAEAMKYYLQALDLFTALNQKEKIATIALNMGVIYEYQKDEKNALISYKKALKIAEQIKDTSIMSAVYNNLGNVYQDKKNYKKALEYLKKSLDLSRKSNDLYTVALDLNNIGDLYKYLNDSVLEFLYYNKALKLARRIQDNGTITLSLYNLAEYYRMHNNLPGAIKSVKKSLQFAQNGGNISDVLSAMNLLHQLYADQHNFKKAYRFLKSYSLIHDSVFSNQKARQLVMVEEKARMIEKNRELLLARDTKKRMEAYFIIYTLLTILILGLFIMWYRIRSVKSKELLRQKLYIDAVLEESTSHVAILDEHFKSTYLSPSLKVFSKDVNSRVGSSVLEFIHPDDMVAMKNIANIMKKGGALHENLIFRLRKSDGEYRTMRGLIKKIEGDQPLLKGYIINFWDITEIQKSQQKLKVANDSKDKLFSIISHDLRGAVGTQKAILDVVQDDLDALTKEEISEIVKTIKKSTDSTYTIVENLLSWARIMRENITPKLSRNNFYTVIKDAMAVLNEQAKSKDISLVYEGSQEITGSFDPDLMNIVFRNLISNAIKFSKPADEIKVRCLRNEGGIEISVEDHGVGMSQDQIKKILSNTVKLDSQRGTKNEKGTGLGLIIVKEFIAMNRGELSIESEPGKGTRFIIRFPLDTSS